MEEDSNSTFSSGNISIFRNHPPNSSGREGQWEELSLQKNNHVLFFYQVELLVMSDTQLNDQGFDPGHVCETKSHFDIIFVLFLILC